jgi:hypothetical protein
MDVRYAWGNAESTAGHVMPCPLQLRRLRYRPGVGHIAIGIEVGCKTDWQGLGSKPNRVVAGYLCHPPKTDS